jgi:hypothetical protein
MNRNTFRAKAIVNQKHSGITVGDWVTGSFIQSRVDAPCIIFGYGEQIEIDIETLGQFITSNEFKQPIFEGDFGEFEHLMPEEMSTSFGLVYFCEETLCYRVKDLFGEKDPLAEITGKVIGNKFDNKDMLEKVIKAFN